MGEVTETLRMASDKLAEGPHRWTKGAFARNTNGLSVPAQHGDAWCSIGAIRWAIIQQELMLGPWNFVMIDAEGILAEAAGIAPSFIPTWNDVQAIYPEVLDTFQKAVKLADERGL